MSPLCSVCANRCPRALTGAHTLIGCMLGVRQFHPNQEMTQMDDGGSEGALDFL